MECVGAPSQGGNATLETHRVTFISPNALHAPATRAKENNSLLRIRSRSDFDSPLLLSTTLELSGSLSRTVCLSLSLSGSHSCSLFWTLCFSDCFSPRLSFKTVSLSQAASFTQNVYFSDSLPLYETTVPLSLSFYNRLNPLSLCKHDLRASSLLLRTDLPKL